MSVFDRKMGSALSDGARKRVAALKPYPSLDMWRNPVTRGFARRLQNEEWRKCTDEIEFDYRLTDESAGGVEGVHYETARLLSGAPIFLYVHGGGFVAGGPTENAATILGACYACGFEAFGPAYSLLPDAMFPTQIDEVTAVYDAMCTELTASKIILLAESTGAAIALSALMKWRDDGAPLPRCAVFLSPCVDGLGASDTQISMDGRDPVIRSMRGSYMRNLFRFYAPEHDPADPAVSPIYGDFHGLPPILAQAGSREVLLGDAARLIQAATRAGVDARLHIFDGMYHRFHAHWSLEETRGAHNDIAAFIASL